MCFDVRCNHYRRRCRIRAPCCNEIYSCRHCHNEAAVFLSFSFIFTSNYLPFCFYLIWVGLVFPIRACWRIPLIATSSFAKMLNKYHKTAFHFLFFCYELGTMSVRLIHFLHLFAVSGCLFSLWHWATCMYFCQFSFDILYVLTSWIQYDFVYSIIFGFVHYLY